MSAQEAEIRYNPLCSDRSVFVVDDFESVIEFKCYEIESDTGNNFVLLNMIRNFSNQDFIWELTAYRIYNGNEQFKPIGYQIISSIDNLENSLPKISIIDPIKDIEVKSNSVLSFLMLFSKSVDSDIYKSILDEVQADLIVETASLRNQQNEKYIFRLIYLTEAD